MTDSIVQQNNDLLSRNLMLLSSYPVGFYNQLWNENNELKKDNDSLTESNRVLRKRNFDYRDKIDELNDILNPPKKKQRTSKYEFTNFRKNKDSYNEHEINRVLYNIKTIKDIINLDDKWRSIRHNSILQRLYNIIPPLKKLDNMIGLDSVKKNLFKKNYLLC